MPPIAVPGAWQVTVVQNGTSGEVAVNTWCVQTDGTPLTQGLADAIAESFRLFYYGLRTYRSDETSIGHIYVDDLGNPGTTGYDAVLTNSAAGTDPYTLPYDIACCISLLTSQRGRSYRGRIFLGHLGRTCLDPNNPYFVAGFVTAVQAEMVTLEDNLQATAGVLANLAVHSRKLGLSTQVGRSRVGYVPDRIRRRRNKLGEQYSTQVLL